MGRSRHKYNKSETHEVIQTSQKKVKLDGDMAAATSQDASNPAMIIPGETRMKKLPNQQCNLPPKLNKKKRKQLERVLDQKKKKANRVQLLEKLKKVKIDPSELAMMDSVAHIGTRNSRMTSLSKRPVMSESLKKAMENYDEDLSLKIEQSMTSRKGKRRKRARQNKKNKKAKLEEEDEEEDEELEVVKLDGQTPQESIDTHPTPDTSDEEVDEEEEEHIIQQQSALETRPPSTDDVTKKDQTTPVIKCEPKTYIHLDRTTEIQEARLNLPILAEEQEIMEHLNDNDVIIICGQTGSGKTTQVPQFLYEAGYALKGMIGITEPRRVAAVSMASRVAKEMNLPSSKISHQVRYNTSVTDETEIKFMTDGILPREMAEDFLLTKYSAIIIDEAHERTANTDLLIGLLSRVVPVRRKRYEKTKKGSPLKLIIMSATLRVQDFTESKPLKAKLFRNPPPVINIEVRQFDVKVRFNKRTPGYYGNEGDEESGEDTIKWAYMKEAYKKVCKIHRQLPPGAILVFVTGQQEVHALISKLNNTFPKQMPKVEEKKELAEPIQLDNFASFPEDDVTHPPPAPEEVRVSDDDEDGGAGSDFEMDDVDLFTEVNDSMMPLHVLPLYAVLPSHKQKLVFQPPPEGTRLCVVATNVAETSLTIPGVKYVVDTGKVKRRIYDKTTGVSCFRVTWISQASANQRAGRAGRTEEGHAYRLYSSAVFDDFEKFEEPEIQSKPVSSLVLQMKAMNIDRVVNFPFPTPPSEEALRAAENLLISLGAIDAAPQQDNAKDAAQRKIALFSGKITELGTLMSAFPLHPRFSKIISAAIEHRRDRVCDVIQYVVVIVAALTVGELFLNASAITGGVEEASANRQKFSTLLKSVKSALVGTRNEDRHKLGDFMAMLGAIGMTAYGGKDVCYKNCLRPKAVAEVLKLRRQLTMRINEQMTESAPLLPEMTRPSDKQIKQIRKILLSAFGDHVARKSPPVTSDDPKIRRKMKNAYQCSLIDEPVFIHPDSCLFTDDTQPEYVIFHELTESEGGRTYMRDVCEIDPTWLADTCPQHCTFSTPLELPEKRWDGKKGEVVCHVNVKYGKLSWPIGQIEIVHPLTLDKYRHFAKYLLQGDVVMKLLKTITKCLVSTPATMVKEYAHLIPRTKSLLRALTTHDVHNRAKLLEEWKKNPNYLQAEYLEWVADSAKDRLVLAWPPLSS